MDIVKYAEKNRCAVTIKPLFKEGKLKQWEVHIDVNGSSVMEITDQITEQFLDSLLAKIGRSRASHYGNLEQSRKRAEMEKFWKESTPILTGRNDREDRPANHLRRY